PSDVVVYWSCAPGPSRLPRPGRHSPKRAPSPALPSSDGSALLITSCWPVRLLGLTAPDPAPPDETTEPPALCAEKEGNTMAYQRPSQRELAAARKVVRQGEMDRASAEGRLTVRTMTAPERTESDARWAGAA